MAPTISSIIPLYQLAHTVPETIRSLLAQTWRDWEAIVVDDGSTDGGARAALDAAGGDPRVRVIHQPNAGLAAARNTGLEAASGTLVHFLDSDDWMLPLGFELLLDRLRASGAPAACGPCELRGEAGEPLGRTLDPPPGGVGLGELRRGNALQPHSHLVERARFESPRRRFDTSLRVAEDYAMWARLAADGVRWAVTRQPVAAYRVRRGSMSKNGPLMRRTVERLVREIGGADRDARANGAVYPLASALAARDPAIAAETVRGLGLDAAELGALLGWALLLGAGEPIERLLAETGWMPAAAAAVEAGATDRAAAWSAFASVLCPPQRLARELVRRARDSGAERVCLIGCGRNGREVAAVCRETGLSFEARDDDRHAAAGLGEHGDPAVERPLPRGTAAIVTPGDDGALLSRIASEGPVLRWSAVERDARRAVLDRLGLANGRAAAG